VSTYRRNNFLNRPRPRTVCPNPRGIRAHDTDGSQIGRPISIASELDLEIRHPGEELRFEPVYVELFVIEHDHFGYITYFLSVSMFKR
jgi:hypothetical protein